MILANKQFEFVALSDTGQRRPHNEDSAVSDISIGLLMVADGMGGYKAGEVASAMAANSVLVELQQQLPMSSKAEASDAENGLAPESVVLRAAIMHANLSVYETAMQEPDCQGMGTTVVAMLFHSDMVTFAHVGDSRAYRFREGELRQMTNDHSLVQELIDRGFFTPEEAHANTPKNLVTRALGIDSQVQVDVTETIVKPGDLYLACSDGLNDMISDEEILLTLSKYGANLDAAAENLVKLANEKGGKDNITVVLARARDGFAAKPKLLGRFG